jgi:VIT1/CCC1 family predicted Fe2+/Mn2+ transporter
MALTNIEVILAVGVAVWTATSALLNGAKLINERRDVVLVGKLKDQALTREHRRIILYSDWLPMTFGVGLLCLGAILAVTVLPWLFMDKQWYAVGLSLIGGLMFVMVGGWYVIGGIAEFRLMKRALEASGDPTTN